MSERGESSSEPPLLGRHPVDRDPLAQGGAAVQQSHGLRRPAVVAQRREVQAGEVVQDDVVARSSRDPARSARPDQVVGPRDPQRVEDADFGGVPARPSIAGDDRIHQRRRGLMLTAIIVVDSADTDLCRVAADRAGGQGGFAEVRQAPAEAGRVAGDRAVGQRRRDVPVVHQTAAGVGRVAADRTVGQARGAQVDEQAAAELRGRVAADRAVGHRGRAAGIHAGTIVADGVAADRAVGHRGRTAGVHPAAQVRGVAADRAVGQGQRAGAVHSPAIFGGGVAADRAIGERRRPLRVQAAAHGRLAAGDRQPGDRRRRPRVDLEHPAGIVGGDGQQPGPRSLNGDRGPAAQLQRALAQRDRLRRVEDRLAEVDDNAIRGIVGLLDGPPQGVRRYTFARAADHERRGESAILQLQQARPEPTTNPDTSRRAPSP